MERIKVVKYRNGENQQTDTDMLVFKNNNLKCQIQEGMNISLHAFDSIDCEEH